MAPTRSDRTNRIIVFTRYPQPGKTKTRLINTLGAEGAANLHRSLTEHTLQNVQRFSKAEIEVRWTGGDEQSMQAWLPELCLRQQCEGDLGARMHDALRAAFEAGVARAVVVGCDSPDLDAETYAAAFEALLRREVVLGPAVDGGYYLIGARAEAADRLGPLFIGVDWGTDKVFEQTSERIDRAGLSYARTAVLDDVDRPEDLPVWEKHTGSARTPWLSVIIPALNEGARIGSTLQSVMSETDVEIIVVDGGSTDDTGTVVASRGIRAIHSARGRAHQMNLGAAKASGEVLLFLHADTQLPLNYANTIRECLGRPGIIAGAFRFQTDLNTLSMRIVTAFAALRASAFQLPYGDQGLFLRKDAFRRAGGFPAFPLMEDYEFVRRLRRFGRIAITNSAAITSGDRWRTLGVWHATLRNARIVALYHLGVSPERLAEIYRRKPERNG